MRIEKKMAGGKPGFMVKRRPRAYPLTEQQKKLKNVLAICGVKPGISKVELQRLMRECIGPKMKEQSND